MEIDDEKYRKLITENYWLQKENEELRRKLDELQLKNMYMSDDLRERVERDRLRGWEHMGG